MEDRIKDKYSIKNTDLYQNVLASVESDSKIVAEKSMEISGVKTTTSLIARMTGIYTVVSSCITESDIKEQTSLGNSQIISLSNEIIEVKKEIYSGKSLMIACKKFIDN